MSGIAEVLVNLGYRVQGSDVAENANVQRLRGQGHPDRHRPRRGQSRRGEVVVVSSAIKRDNPELKAARERLLPVVRRAEMLAELMRLKQAIAIAGTHGKTTTTSMVAALLDAGGFDPTVINGGIINAYGTNARMGASDWMVVEADESDGTFVKLPADVALVTNIDPEHLDHYGIFDKVREAFRQFVENVPFYGFAVMCIDHPEVQALIGRIEDRRDHHLWREPAGRRPLRRSDAATGGSSLFTALIRDRHGGATTAIENLAISMPGEHNVQNATGAIAVAHHLGIVRQGDPPGPRRLRRRQAALHPHRHLERRRDHRRLRPPPGRDRRGAEGGAVGRDRPRHRRRPAAPLHAAPRSLRPVLRLLQRCRHGDRRAGLCGGRGADRRHRPRRAGRRPAHCAATATRARSPGRRRSPR